MTRREFVVRWQGPWAIIPTLPDPELLAACRTLKIEPMTIIPVYGRIVSTSRQVGLAD